MDERYPGYWECSSEEILRRNFPIHRSCRDGDLQQLCSLLTGDLNGTLSVEDHFYSWTPCHWAAYYGKVDCLQKLISCGFDVNTSNNRFQQTAAHVAAFGGRAECLLCLIQFGIDCSKKDYLGETALHKAARSGSVECLKVLSACGMDISVMNGNGNTAPELATISGHQECGRLLEQLLQNGHPNPLGQHHLPNGHLALVATASRKRAVASLDHHHQAGEEGGSVEAKKPRVYHPDHAGSSSDIEPPSDAKPNRSYNGAAELTQSGLCNGNRAAVVCHGHSSTATHCCSMALDGPPAGTPPASHMDLDDACQPPRYGSRAFSSSVEHEDCLRVQQGYDSLMHDALTYNEINNRDLELPGW